MLGDIGLNVWCVVFGTTTGRVCQAGSHDACNATAKKGVNVLEQKKLNIYQGTCDDDHDDDDDDDDDDNDDDDDDDDEW